MGPIPPWSLVPSHRCMRDLGTGLTPTGYKLMRRAPHSKRAPPWCQLNKRNRNRNFNAKRERGINRNAPLQRNGRTSLSARHALSPSTPRALRRDPAGFGGVDRSARPSKGVAHAINAELHSREALLLLKRKKERKLLTREAWSRPCHQCRTAFA